jgi:hypothetical protein
MDKPVYLPPFLNDPGCDLTAVDDADWLTDDLKEEITKHFPDTADIDKDRARCKVAFEMHALEMFPSGRLFASFVQLRVAVDMFQKAWGASTSHGSSRLVCFYGKPTKMPRVTVVEPEKQRARTPSLKEKMCPFKILYSLQGRQKGAAKQPNIYYQVKITTTDYEHTCELSPTSCRLALKGAGKLIPNLAGLQDILSILRATPNTDYKLLRALLQKYVPFYLSLDGTYIRNFRLRALNYIDNTHDLTMVEARALTSKVRSAADEFVTSDNPIFAKNFKVLLRKTMQEDGNTWEALKYLRTLKEEVAGFDFRIQYDPKGRPIAICWMLPHMRTNLLRYGDVIFLDTMMKDYNKLSWPYMGPTVKDGEMKVRQVSECIAIEEKLDIYQFVLHSMASMERRWLLSSLRIIFADQFITKTLLENLGIASTCTLRCDYHHVINEVWPKQFGISKFKALKPYLSRMLKSNTEEEYKLSYGNAMEVIADDPIKASYVEKIYENPQYYSGHFLRTIPGNLKMMGSAPAEQNHSSVAAHLGKGANWTIPEHVRQLIERQNTLEKSIHHHDNKLYTSSLNFRSELIGQEKRNEEAAKKHLTKFAYSTLFIRSRDSSKELLTETKDNGSIHIWPHYRDMESNRTIVLLAGQRCGCPDRIAYQYQCCHELAVDQKIDLDKYNPRWFMSRVFRHKFPLICEMPSLLSHHTVVNFLGTDDSVNEMDNVSTFYENENDRETVMAGIDKDTYDRNMNYSFALSRCATLCKAAGHDKVALSSVVSLVDEAMERMRQGLHINPTYSNVAAIGDQGNEENIPLRPLPAVPGVQRHPTTQNRFRSSIEIGRSRGQKRRANGEGLIGRHVPAEGEPLVGRHVDSSTPDTAFLPPLANTGKRTKTCTLCRQKGHTVRHCPSLEPYKGIPLARKDSDARDQLSISLAQANLYSTWPLDDSYLPVFKSLPSGVEALIIHARMLFKQNYVFKCTVLHNGGLEHERYTKSMFQLGCIAKHVTKNQENVVISELQFSLNATAVPVNVEPYVVAPYLSQLTQQSMMSQYSTFSQVADDAPRPMGFGIP